MPAGPGGDLLHQGLPDPHGNLLLRDDLLALQLQKGLEVSASGRLLDGQQDMMTLTIWDLPACTVHLHLALSDRPARKGCGS